MKVKLTVSRAGARWTQRAGEVVEVGQDEGKRLIELQRAVPVQDEPKRATRKPQESR